MFTILCTARNPSRLAGRPWAEPLHERITHHALPRKRDLHRTSRVPCRRIVQSPIDMNGGFQTVEVRPIDVPGPYIRTYRASALYRAQSVHLEFVIIVDCRRRGILIKKEDLKSFVA